MEKRAFVKSIEGAEAIVEVYRTSSCGSGCGKSCSGCASAGKPILITALNSIGAHAGDAVIIESKSSAFLSLAFLTYLAPVITLVLGYMIGNGAGLSEAVSALCALGGLLVGFIPAAVINRTIKNRKLVPYRIVRADSGGEQV